MACWARHYHHDHRSICKPRQPLTEGSAGSHRCPSEAFKRARPDYNMALNVRGGHDHAFESDHSAVQNVDHGDTSFWDFFLPCQLRHPCSRSRLTPLESTLFSIVSLGGFSYFPGAKMFGAIIMSKRFLHSSARTGIAERMYSNTFSVPNDPSFQFYTSRPSPYINSVEKVPFPCLNVLSYAGFVVLY